MSETDSDRSNGPPTELSKADLRHLETLEGKLQLVRDYTSSVAMGRTGGYYLFGNGGCGKSYTVIKELERLRVPRIESAVGSSAVHQWIVRLSSIQRMPIGL